MVYPVNNFAKRREYEMSRCVKGKIFNVTTNEYEKTKVSPSLRLTWLKLQMTIANDARDPIVIWYIELGPTHIETRIIQENQPKTVAVVALAMKKTISISQIIQHVMCGSI